MMNWWSVVTCTDILHHITNLTLPFFLGGGEMLGFVRGFFFPFSFYKYDSRLPCLLWSSFRKKCPGQQFVRSWTVRVCLLHNKEKAFDQLISILYPAASAFRMKLRHSLAIADWIALATCTNHDSGSLWLGVHTNCQYMDLCALHPRGIRVLHKLLAQQRACHTDQATSTHTQTLLKIAIGKI